MAESLLFLFLFVAFFFVGVWQLVGDASEIHDFDVDTVFGDFLDQIINLVFSHHLSELGERPSHLCYWDFSVVVRVEQIQSLDELVHSVWLVLFLTHDLVNGLTLEHAHATTIVLFCILLQFALCWIEPEPAQH